MYCSSAAIDSGEVLHSVVIEGGGIGGGERGRGKGGNASDPIPNWTAWVRWQVGMDEKRVFPFFRLGGYTRVHLAWNRVSSLVPYRV